MVETIWRLPSLQQAATGMKVPFNGHSVFAYQFNSWHAVGAYCIGRMVIFDMKIIGSFLLLAVYGFVLFLHQSGKLTGNDYAWANVFAFLFVIINFFLGSRLSEFHFWV